VSEISTMTQNLPLDVVMITIQIQTSEIRTLITTVTTTLTTTITVTTITTITLTTILIIATTAATTPPHFLSSEISTTTIAIKAIIIHTTTQIMKISNLTVTMTVSINKIKALSSGI
jgi:hypothetical protein